MNSRVCPIQRGSARDEGLWRLVCAIIAILIVAIQTLSAQEAQYTTNDSSRTASASKAISIKGDAGTFGELYNISGHASRRPNSTGRLFLHSTITAWNSVSASFNFMLSTEGNSARQDINQLDFNPRWRWGQAHIGDFCEEFTPLTLSGVKVRGGGLLLNPGKWRLGVISGMTARSVSTDNSNRSYERSISGARIGYGQSNGSFFDFYTLTARDRLSSLANAPIDSADTTVPDFEQNPLTVTPQENLVVAAVTNLVFLKRQVKWRSEVGASAITRDRRSAELTNSGVPEFLTNLFTPRKSSGADFAYTSDLNLDMGKSSFNVGFHYIGPGYVSLGVASLISDKQEIVAGTTRRFKSGLVKLDAALQHDNLIHQKIYTTDRSRINALIAYRPSATWNITAGATYIGMANDSPSDTTLLDYTSWILRTGQYLTFRRQLGLRSLSVDITYQQASDKNPFRQAAGAKTTSATLTTIWGVNRSLDVVPSAGLISARAGIGSRILTQSYAVSARHSAIQRRLTSSATVSVLVGDVTTTLRPSLRSNYDLDRNFSIAAEFDATSQKGGAPSSRFDEIAARLIVTRRF